MNRNFSQRSFEDVTEKLKELPVVSQMRVTSSSSWNEPRLGLNGPGRKLGL